MFFLWLIPFFGWVALAKNNKNKFEFGWVAIAYKAWLDAVLIAFKPTLYAVAYGCFFWRRFLFVALAQLFYFFSSALCVSKKNKCAVLRWYKNYDRKTDGTTAKPIYFYYFFCVGGWVIISSAIKRTFIFYRFFLSLL